MDHILEMRNITKTFPGVIALNRVNLKVKTGEIHCVVGENGAGKSTLMNILSGVYSHGSYTGEIFFQGKKKSFRHINESEACGIIIIHQELALVPLLSIAENIFLGNELSTNGIIDWSETFQKTNALLKKVGLDELPGTLITNLGVGKQQLVEIAKALSKQVKLLILDEPTSSLNENESDALLELLLEFKRQGISSILISHKLHEVSKVADTITVIRDGSAVSTISCKEESISEDRIIKDMVGRELKDRFPPRTPKIGNTIFEVKNWNVYHQQHPDWLQIKGVNFHVKEGEILGIAGLMGAGRTELAMSIFGRSYGQKISGEAYLDGSHTDISSIEKAVNAGISYVTEDRKNYGLILGESIKHNISLANLRSIAPYFVIDDNKEISVAHEYRDKLNIRCFSAEQDTRTLSGGNQQKVVLAKWLFANPKVLILDEPTRGIDVGAKFEIYSIINKLAEQGKGIVVISSDMPELLGICDRICVMNDGELIGELMKQEASQEKIMELIIKNGNKNSHD